MLASEGMPFSMGKLFICGGIEFLCCGGVDLIAAVTIRVKNKILVSTNYNDQNENIKKLTLDTSFPSKGDRQYLYGFELLRIY